MADIPAELYYTEEHEYVKPTTDEGIYQVGITDYAQGELGDIVYLELPEAGESFERSETFGTIEAVKAVSDLFAPISGEIVAVNLALEDDPALVNADPYGDGWMIRMEISDESELAELMSADEYELHIGEATD